MNLDTADPDAVAIADVNERSEARMISGLQGNVAERGVLQPPLVRSDGEGGLECVAGGRRVIAAQRAHLDELPVLVVKWSDAEALAASISENAAVFREEVSAQDRAEALGRLWKLRGGEGRPVAAPLADDLGAPRRTVDEWLEPLREEWAGTDVEPGATGGEAAGSANSTTSADSPRESGGKHEPADGGENDSAPTPGDSHPVTADEHEPGGTGGASNDGGEDEPDEPLDVDAVGERNLREIRLATGGGEVGVELAREVADGTLGREDLREIKGRVRRGEDLQTAVEAATAEEETVTLDGGTLAAVGEATQESEALSERAESTSESDGTNERDPVVVEASFDGEAADALEGAALATDREPVAIVEEGAVEYLDAKGWFQ